MCVCVGVRVGVCVWVCVLKHRSSVKLWTITSSVISLIASQVAESKRPEDSNEIEERNSPEPKKLIGIFRAKVKFDRNARKGRIFSLETFGY